MGFELQYLTKWITRVDVMKHEYRLLSLLCKPMPGLFLLSSAKEIIKKCYKYCGGQQQMLWPATSTSSQNTSEYQKLSLSCLFASLELGLKENKYWLTDRVTFPCPVMHNIGYVRCSCEGHGMGCLWLLLLKSNTGGDKRYENQRPKGVMSKNWLSSPNLKQKNKGSILCCN